MATTSVGILAGDMLAKDGDNYGDSCETQKQQHYEG